MQIDESAKSVYPDTCLFRPQDFAEGAAWDWLIPLVFLGRNDRDPGFRSTVYNKRLPIDGAVL